MKFKKFFNWKEKRQAGKGKSTPSTPEKKSASSGGSPTCVRNSSEECMNISPRLESVPAAEGGFKSNKGDVAQPTTRQAGLLSNMEEDRPCFLFEDNEDDNINGRNHDNNEDNVKANSDLKDLQLSKLMMPTPMTPNAEIDAPLISSPKNLFHRPPQEIMVDHLAVPPSPMREPNVKVVTSPSMEKNLLDDYRPSMFLNFEDSSPREAAPHAHCVGDPVGDIAMHRQLMDAQRLVRIILGKPLHKNQEILGASSILEAIKSYALMKAELMDLRKKQEIIDGDPPAILQTLGSPAVTTPSTTRTGMGGLRTTPGLEMGIKINESVCESIGHESAQSKTNLDPPITSALEQANETIRRVQRELTTANRTILELKENDFKNSTKVMSQVEQSEHLEQNHHQPDEVIREEPEFDKDPEPREEKLVTEIEGSQQPIKNDDQSKLKETKQDGGLDLLLDEIVLIPQRVLTKDIVREKLELYYHNVAQNSSADQILEMKKKMQQSQEESDRRILEMETKLQEQEYKQQMQEVFSNNEQIADAKRDQNQNTVLIELSHNTTGNTAVDLSSPVKK